MPDGNLRTPSASLDIVIIGAGLSGIGAAVHLGKQCPDKSLAVLEMRGAMGGTWDLFRYPGIRSDSDMLTLGYRFKPWTEPQAIADGSNILRYIQETAREFKIEEKIRYHHRVLALDWCGKDARWRITVERTDTSETFVITCRFVLCCAGYYKYENGHCPDFPGQDEFAGTRVHPQHWPSDLKVEGRRIVVIGSGATAVTLVPALAERGAQVTMLQRSPSYVASLPRTEPAYDQLRRRLSPKLAYALARAQKIAFQLGVYQLARRFPKKTRAVILARARRELGPDFDLRHFSPSYDVWDERLCAVPDGDLFKVLRSGQADVVTDRIRRFTPGGILLESGQELKADIIVTATGLELQVLGGSQLTVDGKSVKLSERLSYKGAMLEGVPNLALVFGYTNASWTLKAELIQDWFCRLIRHMDHHDYAVCVPQRGRTKVDSAPFLDMSSGYVQRALSRLPRQGRRRPWKLYQNYLLDALMFRFSPLRDGALTFSRRPSHAGRDVTARTGTGPYSAAR